MTHTWNMIVSTVLMASISGLTPTQAQTVSTDQPDYPPGAIVQISGSGFTPDLPVMLQVLHAGPDPEGDPLCNPDGSKPPDYGHQPWWVVAGPDGSFTSEWYVHPCDSIGETFILTAEGVDGLYAETTFTDAPLVTDFRQAANDDGLPGGLGDIHWINSIIQQSNSVYAEGMSVPQRTVFTSVAPTTGDAHTLTFSHQATKAGFHAYDFLTSYDQSETVGESILTAIQGSAVNILMNECGDEIGPPGSLGATCSTLHGGANTFTVSVPNDPFVSKDGSTQAIIDAYELCEGNRTIKLYGNAPITAASLTLSHTVADGGDTGDSDIKYVLSWTSASTQILIEMAGHLAVGDATTLACGGWGTDLGSSVISGGPYHFNLDKLDGSSLGSQDNQIKGADVFLPPPEGACCLADGSCVILTESGCEDAGGVYQGDESTCTPNPCHVGACCVGSSCIITSQDACALVDGVYQGDDSTCEQSTCPPPCDSACPDDATVECGEDTSPASTGFAACDSLDCTGACVATFSDSFAPGCGNTGVITRTWTCECSAGGTVSTCVQTITIVDTTPPTLDNCAPAEIPLGCNPDIVPGCDPAITASDTCGSATVDCTLVDSEEGCNHTRTITYLAVDECDNPSEPCVVTYTWIEDLTPPEFEGCESGTTDLGCNPDPAEIMECELSVTAIDNCDDDPVVTCASKDEVDGCVHTRTITYTAVDECENTATCVQVVTWTEDTTPPTFDSCPRDVDLGCNPQDVPGCDDGVTASDDCGPASVSCDMEDFVDGCERIRIVTYIATDSCENTSECVQIITWTEVTAPVLDGCPRGGDLGCNPTPPSCDKTVSASNDCGPVEVVCEAGEIMVTGCNRSQTFTYTATACGLSSTCSATYTWTEVTAPVLAGCPRGGDLGCNPTPPSCDKTVGASNECGPVEVVCEDGEILVDGCSRSQTFTYAATACELSSSCSVTYTWTEASPPVLTGCPRGGDLGCNPTPPSCDKTVGASNDCGPVEVVCEAGEILVDGCNRSQTFTYTATSCELSSSCSATYTWTEVTAPVLEGCPKGADLGCNPISLPSCDKTVSASNECGPVEVSCEAGEILIDGCNRSQTFTYTATSCELSSSCSATYSWTEVTAPVLAGCPSGGNLGCNPTPPSCDPKVSASNECGPVEVVCEAGEILIDGCNRSQTFTYTATSCGLSSSCSATYTWTVASAPVLSGCPSGGNLGCNPTPPSCDSKVSASNECGPVEVVCEAGEILIDGCNRSQTFTYTATSCGLSSSCSATYTWTDDLTPPVLTGCPDDAFFSCITDVPPPATVTAVDACNGSVGVSFAQTTTGTFCSTTITRTWSAMDSCSNPASCTQVIIVVDNVAPVLTCPANMTVSVPPDGCCAVVNFQTTVVDNCDNGPIQTCDWPSGSCFPIGTTTVTCSATDKCGNTGFCSFTVTVTTQICGAKFYDADLDGQWDDDEAPIAGWKVQLTGPSGPQTTYTAADGSYCFTVSALGSYTVQEVAPSSKWLSTTGTSCQVSIGAGQCHPECVFGNICLGAGGGFTPGFWSNQNGKAILQAHDALPAQEWRALLTALCLRKASGANYDVPMGMVTFASAYDNFRTWLLGATAVNMAYKLSSHLAAMELNVFIKESVDGESLVYAPGCGGFVTVDALMAAANAALCADGFTPSGDPNRPAQDCLKDALDKANNNENFVQTGPCPFATPY